MLRIHILHGAAAGLLVKKGLIGKDLIGKMRDDLGFGYDPIFQPVGLRKTFGQMSIKEKSNYSHRGKAAQLMIPHLLSEFHRNS